MGSEHLFIVQGDNVDVGRNHTNSSYIISC